MDKDLKILNFIIDRDDFFCGFIVIDDLSLIKSLKDSISLNAEFIESPNSINDIVNIKEKVKNNSKIIVYDLKNIYDIFSQGDKKYHDGIFQFYQKFTEAYRDDLWAQHKGQLYFVLTPNELEKFYKPDGIRCNHFITMLMRTFYLEKEKIYRKN